MKKVSYINLILRVNQISYVITGLLFIIFPLGLMAEMGLGALQIISSLLVLLFWKDLTRKLKNRTYYYWIALVVYVVSFYLMSEFGFLSDFDGMAITIIVLVLIPMSIGLYLLLHLSSIKKSFKS